MPNARMIHAALPHGSLFQKRVECSKEGLHPAAAATAAAFCISVFAQSLRVHRVLEMNAVPLLNYAQVFNFTLHFKVVVTIAP